MKHLTEQKRHEISAYLKSGKSQSFIAQALGVNKSCISRELKRNCDMRNNSYRPELAQRKSQERKEAKHKAGKFTQRMIRIATVLLVRYQYSPEQIAGYCRVKGITMVSPERLYQWIWADKKHGGLLDIHLRRKGRKYRKRGNSKDTRGIIKDRVDIDQRPAIVEEKTRFGDLEFDTVIGQNHKGALLTINDRVTGLVWIRLLTSKEANPLTNKAIEALMPFKDLLHTATADNGKEFAFHQKIAEALKISVYFAKPYHSWERGANENTNGLIRQYFPKGSSFEMITDQEVQEVQDKLNNRPRKRLGFLSPNEMFFKVAV